MSVSCKLHWLFLHQLEHASGVRSQLSRAEHGVRESCEVTPAEDERALVASLTNLIVVWECGLDWKVHSLNRHISDVVDVHFLWVFLVDIDLLKHADLLLTETLQGLFLLLLFLLFSFNGGRNTLPDMLLQILIRPRNMASGLRALKDECQEYFPDGSVNLNQLLLLSALTLPLRLSCNFILRTLETVQHLAVRALFGLVYDEVANATHEVL